MKEVKISIRTDELAKQENGREEIRTLSVQVFCFLLMCKEEALGGSQKIAKCGRDVHVPLAMWF